MTSRQHESTRDAPSRMTAALAKARETAIFAVSERWRGQVASALPARLVPPEMRPGFFEHFFDDGDPFGFDVNPEEQLKFRRTLEVCGEQGRGSVLELGCAVGSFTEVLAPAARAVLAVDVSQAAVEQVRRRLAAHAHVRAQALSIPEAFPDEDFDLVVASDVLYYLPVDRLRHCVARIERSLTAGGAFVPVHYVPRMGSVLSGDEAHDVIASCATLRHELAERTEFGAGRTYRVDRYVKD